MLPLKDVANYEETRRELSKALLPFFKQQWLSPRWRQIDLRGDLRTQAACAASGLPEQQVLRFTAVVADALDCSTQVTLSLAHDARWQAVVLVDADHTESTMRYVVNEPVEAVLPKLFKSIAAIFDTIPFEPMTVPRRAEPNPPQPGGNGFISRVTAVSHAASQRARLRARILQT